ncbi:hypothetical protein K502DRAFT_338075 [Neoconidiobolus thromboides FSU 785]|nr:hypothetical protein K502DRAFT_338075 [Neoconidiobolus thromboides FSU 785]
MSTKNKSKKGSGNWENLKKELLGKEKVAKRKKNENAEDKESVKSVKVQKESIRLKKNKNIKDVGVKEEITKNKIKINNKIQIEDKTKIVKSKVIKETEQKSNKLEIVKQDESLKSGEDISDHLKKLLLGEFKANISLVTKIGKILAIDCEMVGVGVNASESALARVSIVNYYGIVIYDTHVKVDKIVTDFRTWVSGILPKHLKDAPSFEEVQIKVLELLKNRILVGHSIKNDLKALKIQHPERNIRDTAKYYPLKQINNNKAPSLKKLCTNLLGIDIQGASHSSVEDAQATMAIYRRFETYWEQSLRANK